jgi:hypothetical protein
MDDDVTVDELKKLFQEQYIAAQMPDGDPAIDLLDPAAATLLMPYWFDPSMEPGKLPLKRFNEYFRFGESRLARVATGPCGPIRSWPVPPDCPQVFGNRGTFGLRFQQLFAGDLVWLFYFERMGIHRMVGALLDDFVSRGKFPLRPAGLTGLVLEVMVRELKSGLSSTVRERDTSYRRCLGWTSEAGSKLGNDAPVNGAFDDQFHRLVYLALGYYQEKRLAVAIQNTTTVGKPSVATVTSIRDTALLLRRAFDPFKYGRNHTHTLAGIVWTLAGLDLLTRLRSQLGIPEPYNSEEELIPAAYDLLIGGGKPADRNRFTMHRDCAVTGRDILLDVQGMDFDATSPSPEGVVEAWLDEVESKFETYRTAYKALTGVDLGKSGAVIAQRA